MEKMSNLLGLAVFGTSDGLYAEGSGVLSGISNSPEQFEFNHIVQSKKYLRPGGDSVIFRCAAHIKPSSKSIDLIGFVNCGYDASKRIGFYGVCAGLEYKNLSAYAEAYEYVVDYFNKIKESLIVDQSIRRISPELLPRFSSTSKYRHQEYTILNENISPWFLYYYPATWDYKLSPQLIFNTLKYHILLNNSFETGFFVLNDKIEGAKEITLSNLQDLEHQFEDKTRDNEIPQLSNDADPKSSMKSDNIDQVLKEVLSLQQQILCSLTRCEERFAVIEKKLGLVPGPSYQYPVRERLQSNRYPATNSSKGKKESIPFMASIDWEKIFGYFKYIFVSVIMALVIISAIYWGMHYFYQRG